MIGGVFVGGLFLGGVLGCARGILMNFDWKAYFQYKKEYTEMVMKYKKEMQDNG